MRLKLIASNRIDRTIMRSIATPGGIPRSGVRGQQIERILAPEPKLRPMNRREWAAWAVRIGLASTVTGFMVAGPGCEQLAELILATILKFAVSKNSYSTGEPIGGDITLANNSDDDVTGSVDMKLLSSRSIVSSGAGHYHVPAHTENTYEWSGLSSDEPGTLVATAHTMFGEASSDGFDVR